MWRLPTQHSPPSDRTCSLCRSRNARWSSTGPAWQCVGSIPGRSRAASITHKTGPSEYITDFTICSNAIPAGSHTPAGGGPSRRSPPSAAPWHRWGARRQGRHLQEQEQRHAGQELNKHIPVQLLWRVGQYGFVGACLPLAPPCTPPSPLPHLRCPVC